MTEKEIQNAFHHLNNSKKCFEDEMFDLSIVSSYTSMFHCARALLFLKGFKERSHVCLISLLREKYPDLKYYADSMDTFRTARHSMLYGFEPQGLKEDAEFGLDIAMSFIEKVQEDV